MHARARTRLAISTLICVVLGVAPVYAEVYVWTDAAGRTHMTDDLSQVPESQRARAAQAGKEMSRKAAAADAASSSAIPAARVPGQVEPPADPGATAPLPTAPSDGAATKPAPRSPRRATAAPVPKRHVLQVERVGSSMRVIGVVDGVEIPFILDTGATTCTLPAWALESLDIEIDDDTPTVPVSGISGEVMWVPEIRIDSVQVGDAVVSDLHMTVLSTMDEGLLGMPFFNHFKVATDPVAGTLVLEEIDLEQVDEAAGGLNERAWRQKFRQRRHALERVRAQLESVPDEYVTIRERLEKREAYWERQLELLDLEASRAGVPYDWRE